LFGVELTDRWCAQVSIVPVYPTASLSSVASIAADFAAFAEPYKRGDLKHDMALIRWVNDVATRKEFNTDQVRHTACEIDTGVPAS
jgi:hypothetical protein